MNPRVEFVHAIFKTVPLQPALRGRGLGLVRCTHVCRVMFACLVYIQFSIVHAALSVLQFDSLLPSLPLSDTFDVPSLFVCSGTKNKMVSFFCVFLFQVGADSALKAATERLLLCTLRNGTGLSE